MWHRSLPKPLGRSLRHSLLKSLLTATAWTWPNASAPAIPYASTHSHSPCLCPCHSLLLCPCLFLCPSLCNLGTVALGVVAKCHSQADVNWVLDLRWVLFLAQLQQQAAEPQ